MKKILILSVLLLSGIALTNQSDLPRKRIPAVQMAGVPADLLTKHKLVAGTALLVNNIPDTVTVPGVAKGDILVELNGKKFKDLLEYNYYLSMVSTDSVACTVIRGDQKVKTSLPMIERPREHSDQYDVIYDHVVSLGHRVRVIISKPKKVGKFPALFWLQGINATTIDFPISGANYLANMLRPFATADYVTIRVDKHGAGDSEGGPAARVNFFSEVDIYRQVMNNLSKWTFIDRSNVFLFGHSMGGCHAPLIAAEFPVKGIVTYGTVSDSWLEWHIKAARWQNFLLGLSWEEIDKTVRDTVAFFHFLYNEKRPVAWIKKNKPELREVADSQSVDGYMLGQRSIEYMTQLANINFGPYWQKVGSAKVLALFGEIDWIALQADQEQVAEMVNSKNPGQAKYMMVPKSTHGFNYAESMKQDIKGNPSPRFNDATVKITKDWIDSLVKG